jgi:hypothetical protein
MASGWVSVARFVARAGGPRWTNAAVVRVGSYVRHGDQAYAVTSIDGSTAVVEPTEMTVYEMTVTINGTGTNHWRGLGFRQNPFPQIGKAEYDRGERQIASLDGDPIRDEADIRRRLAGFDPEFVDGIVARWTPGERVSFQVTFPEARR